MPVDYQLILTIKPKNSIINLKKNLFIVAVHEPGYVTHHPVSIWFVGV